MCKHIQKSWTCSSPTVGLWASQRIQRGFSTSTTHDFLESIACAIIFDKLLLQSYVLKYGFITLLFPLLLPFLDDKNVSNRIIILGLKSISRSTISHLILFNILIKADVETQHLHLTAYNLEFGMQMNFDANINQPRKLTLPAAILA